MRKRERAQSKYRVVTLSLKPRYGGIKPLGLRRDGDRIVYRNQDFRSGGNRLGMERLEWTIAWRATAPGTR